MNRHLLLFAAMISILASCNRKPEAPPAAEAPPVVSVPSIRYELVRSDPHDTNAFTEGFFIHDGQLFESTGATQELPQTRSLFGIVDRKTGKIVTKAELDRNKYFGEGIVLLNGKIYQLTYTTRVGFVYDARTYKKLGDFNIPTKEGWGLTTDGKYLVMSDGTDMLTWVDPVTFKVVRTLRVTENGYAKDMINELEYVGNSIYANIWTTHTIVKINPDNGKIEGELNLDSLAADAQGAYPGCMEMNGIAWDSVSNTMLVTGKMWPRIYTIRISS